MSDHKSDCTCATCCDELRASRNEWRQQHENALACWHTDNANLLARAKQAEAERDRLRAEAGAAILAVNAIRNEVKSRRWIAEGRGSYEYDDDRYRDETRHAFDAIERHVATAFSGEATQAFAARVAALEAVATAAREAHEECEQAANHRANPARAGACMICNAISDLDALAAPVKP